MSYFALQHDNRVTTVSYLIYVLIGAIIIGVVVPNLVDYLGITIVEAGMLLLLTTVLAIPGIRIIMKKGDVDIFHPIYIFNLVIFFGFVFAPIALLYDGEARGLTLYYRTEYIKAISLTIGGVLSFYMGCFLSATRIYRHFKFFLEHFFRADKEKMSRQAAFNWAVLVWFMTFLGFVFWFLLADIPFSTLNVFDEGTYGLALADQASIHIVYLFLLRLSWASTCSFAMCYISDSWKERVLLGGMIMGSFALILISSNRSMLFGFVIICVASYYLSKQSRPSFSVLVTLVFLAIPATGIIVFARGFRGVEGIVELTQDEGFLHAFTEEFTKRGAFTPLLSMLYAVPRYEEYIGFDIFGFLLYAPIPRFLWPDKPTMSEALLSFRFNYQYWHAPGLFGAYYASFSYIGPIVMLLMYGVVSDTIYRFYRANREHPFRQVLLATWLPMMYTIVFRGEPMIIILRIIYQTGPVFLVLFGYWLWSSRYRQWLLDS